MLKEKEVKKQNYADNSTIVKQPSKEDVEMYLKEWDTYENGKYKAQEDALKKLFSLCKENKELSDILLKVATLNDFYSTHVFSVYAMAQHIWKLKDVDSRLKDGDETLVKEISEVTINGTKKNFYSFASKYCSHHNPEKFPIYDSYVDRVLRHFHKNLKFYKVDDKTSFKDRLKDYSSFKKVLDRFQEEYKLKDVLVQFQKDHGMKNYDLKLLDRYLWLLGKKYFPKKFNSKKEKSEK